MRVTRMWVFRLICLLVTAGVVILLQWLTHAGLS